MAAYDTKRTSSDVWNSIAIGVKQKLDFEPTKVAFGAKRPVNGRSHKSNAGRELRRIGINEHVLR